MIIASALTMSLDHLHERYNQFATLSDQVQLFWTLSSSSDNKRDNEKSSLLVDTIRLAVAYLLPKPLHEIIPTREDGIVVDGNNETNEIDDDVGMDYYWLGFGLSAQGGIIGADMMIYLPPSSSSRSHHSNSSNTERLLDVHGVSYSFPVVDKCGQDWQLVNYSSLIDVPTVAESSSTSSENNWHIVEASRSLQSFDVNEDLPIINDSSKLINPTHVVAAWGRLNLDGADDESNGRLRARKIGQEKEQTNEYLDLTSMIVPHGPSGRVSATVRFVAPTFDDKPVDNNEHDYQYFEKMSYIDLIPQEPFRIPDEETTYKNFCFQLEDYPDLMDVLEEHGKSTS